MARASSNARWVGRAVEPIQLQAHISGVVLGLENPVLFLEVEEGNAPARALYVKRGFVEVGRRNAYYKKADGSAASAIVMRHGIGSL